MDEETTIGFAALAVLFFLAGLAGGAITKRWNVSSGKGGTALGILAFAMAYLFGIIGAAAMFFGWWLMDREIFNRSSKEGPEAAESPNE